jgi:membrane associated rhomboid family serine protease
MTTSVPGVLSRNGLRKFPVVTAAVFAVTAAVNIAQLLAPHLLHTLERTPAGLHGQWWRTGTALLVQDGGVPGTLSNLAFLLVVGVAAEQVLTRRQWLVSYLATGLLSELVGYAWQPTGGGNSIAVCGLAGALALWRTGGQLPVWAPQAVLLWCGAVGATAGNGSTAVTVIAVGAAAAVGAAVRGATEKGLPAARCWGLAVVATGIALSALRNIHGAALLIGIVIAAVPLLAGRAARSGEQTG